MRLGTLANIVKDIGALGAGFSLILGTIGLATGVLARLDWPLVLALVLALVGFGLILGHAILGRSRKSPGAAISSLGEITMAVVGRVFENSTIVLDGKQFSDCTFRNCTLRWNMSAKWALDVKLEGVTRVESPRAEFSGTVDLLRALGFLRPDFAESWVHLPVEHFTVSTGG